jgi:hypothetical protein
MLRDQDITVGQDTHHNRDENEIEIGAKLLFEFLDESTVVLLDIVLCG